jgi:proton-translocating NAD(P)+ transhydrogenase subunit alpha
VQGEQRVALVPDVVPKLIRAGLNVCVETGAGSAAGFGDRQYADQGALIQPQAPFESEIILKVRRPADAEINQLSRNSTVIGLLEPFAGDQHLRAFASRNITAFAMEFMPRVARAQSMDALSAMSTIAGYKAVLMAANRLPKFFPLLMTAAGTLRPAKVFVIGAGVAGLEAIGTARRLGAVVEAYDTRPAVKEEVESVGGKFVLLAIESTEGTRKDGYASAQTEDFYRRQQQLMTAHIAQADVVITAALVRGQRAPTLLTEDMVRAMSPGSVIVDLASDQGGNCSLTSPGEEVSKHGVTILGPVNLPSTMAYDASAMYARTITNFLLHIVRDGKIQIDLEDEITRATLLTHGGEILNSSQKRLA